MGPLALRPAWFALDLPGHLSHFEPASLRKLLEKAGLVVLVAQATSDAGMIRKSTLPQAQNRSAGSPARQFWTASFTSKLFEVFCGYLTRRGLGNDLTVVARKPS